MHRYLTSLLAAAAVGLSVNAATLNYPGDATVAATARSLQAVKLGQQSATVNQQDDKLLYHDLTGTIFTADAATLQSPAFEWSGTWMHGYLYVDLNDDGELTSNELVSGSYYKGKNSLGATAKDDVGVALPQFALPELKAGDYLMRYIVDWDSNDPGGSTTEGNTIVKNSGAIVDITLRVTGAPEAETPYAVNYPAGQTIDASVRNLVAISAMSQLLGTQTVEVNQAETSALYFDLTDCEITAMEGQYTDVAVDWNGDWMNAYVYVDRGGNGDFCVVTDEAGAVMPGSDLLSYSNLNGKNSAGGNGGNTIAIPGFTLPADLTPGNYRLRVKVDWNDSDPGGNTTDGNNIVKNRGCIVDLTLKVIEPAGSVTLTPMAMNGIILDGNGSPLTGTIACGYPRTLTILPTLPGYTCSKVVVRNEQGDTEIELDAESHATIADTLTTSDITLYALFDEDDDSEWTKVWGDEFNAPQLDPKRWSYHPRYNATWNRYVAVTDQGRGLVNHFDGQTYTANCIATPSELVGDDAEREFISGAIYSFKKLDITYGKIEARVKTDPHSGNFPAFWLMPTESLDGGWPCSGEIDIWEQVNATNYAHSTVHSGWTGWKNYCKWDVGPKTGSPASTSQYWVDASLWHVYAIEWDEEELRWYVDGKQTFSYKNQHYSEPGTNYTEQICWPFYKNFYIILNQSVGQQGGWAAAPDANFTYTTRFDYVRVYKRKDDNAYTSAIDHNGDDPGFYVPVGGAEPITPPESSIGEVAGAVPVSFYDLSGRRIDAPRGVCIAADASGARLIKR